MDFGIILGAIDEGEGGSVLFITGELLGLKLGKSGSNEEHTIFFEAS